MAAAHWLATVHAVSVDRVHAYDNGEHAEAGNDVGLVRDIVTNITEAQRCVRGGGALLDMESLTADTAAEAWCASCS